MPSMSQAQVLFFQASITALVYSVCAPSGPTGRCAPSSARVVVARIARIGLELFDVVLRGHRAAAAPRTHCRCPAWRWGRARHDRWPRAPSPSALGCGVVEVLEPVRGLGGRARAHVDRQVGIRADLLREIHELVRAEGIGLDDSTPVGIERRGAAIPGPMPLRQWYSSAKQPPGQRTFGTLMALSAATTSLRMPRVFGMGDSGPTQMPS